MLAFNKNHLAWAQELRECAESAEPCDESNQIPAVLARIADSGTVGVKMGEEGLRYARVGAVLRGS